MSADAGCSSAIVSERAVKSGWLDDASCSNFDAFRAASLAALFCLRLSLRGAVGRRAVAGVARFSRTDEESRTYLCRIWRGITTARGTALRSVDATSSGRTICGGLSYQRPRGSRRSTRPSFSRVGRLIVAEAASSWRSSAELASTTSRTSSSAGVIGTLFLRASAFLRCAARGP